MKNLVVLALSFLSLSLLACPNFSGSFTCQEKLADGSLESYDLTVTQNGNVFTTTDDVGTQDIIADGVRRSFEDAFFITATCSRNAINSTIEGTIPADEFGPEAKIYTEMVVMPGLNSALIMTTTKVSIATYNYENIESSTTNCQRK